eukprot:TRINITY_DN4258_c0_g1_i1.p1 TRINITY_DN4258_c0_g1~~TRINITY_DN4258_c0_g1_i1.p1  ORF type:complete len:650 (+),score=190.66 TRINITY_DN4258_c0_g1_i1:37-1986(+)
MPLREKLAKLNPFSSSREDKTSSPKGKKEKKGNEDRGSAEASPTVTERTNTKDDSQPSISSTPPSTPIVTQPQQESKIEPKKPEPTIEGPKEEIKPKEETKPKEEVPTDQVTARANESKTDPIPIQKKEEPIISNQSPSRIEDPGSPIPVATVMANTNMSEKPKDIEVKVPMEEVGPPEIDVAEIDYNEVDDFLGQGSFGKVYTGRCRGKRVAVKVPLKQRLSDKELEEFRREVAIMKKIFHPNCVLFMGACSLNGQLKMITELMQTDMEKMLKSNRTLTLTERMKMAKDAALGMNWLHGITHLIHRDLKPANLLVDSNLTVKITDYGFSLLKDKTLIKSEGVARGTPLWMAPEIMQGRQFNEKVDVYSYGIILWQILTRDEPFTHHNDFKAFRLAVCKYHERPRIPADTLPALKNLIDQCWTSEFQERPSFQDIIYGLDEVLLQLEIKGDAPREFWKKHFMTKRELQESVPWSEFLSKLESDLESQKPSPDTFRKLKGLLATKTVDDQFVVTMDKFNLLNAWFGEFYLPNAQSLAALEEIRSLMSQDWFHGDISKREAESRLQQRCAGTFLVRLSSTDPQYPFTISMIGNQHRRVSHTHGGNSSFKGSTRQYASVVDLVQNCSDQALAASMQFACPKSIIDPATSGYL